MMLKVPDIIGSNGFQRHGSIVADADWCLQLLRGDAAHDIRKVPVERAPHIHHLFPFFIGVPLHADPVVLGIAGERELGGKLRAHEPLVIIAGGIYEVPQDLFPAPRARRAAG